MQVGEAGEIPIHGEPLGAMFDGERGKIGIRHQIAFGVGLPTEPLENRPMPRSGKQDHGVGLFEQEAAETQRLVKRGGRLEDSRMRHDAQKSGKRQR